MPVMYVRVHMCMCGFCEKIRIARELKLAKPHYNLATSEHSLHWHQGRSSFEVNACSSALVWTLFTLLRRKQMSCKMACRCTDLLKQHA